MTLTNYWWLLIWLVVGGGLLAIMIPKQPVQVLGKTEYRWSWFATFALIVPYILWAGFRSVTYGDTAAYQKMLASSPTLSGDWIQYVAAQSKDKGFTVLTVILKSIVGNNYQIYFLIIASIQLMCILYIYRKFSCNLWLSVFLFVASTDYISWMHNGIRQFLAVTLIFSASELILEKKYLKVILVILLAATIHGSAVLMIPIVFIVQGKPWNKKTIMFLVAAMVAIIFVDQFTNILDTLLTDTQYTNVVQDWKDMNDNGTNPIRVLVNAVPTILSLIGFRYIKAEDNRLINIAVNMSACSVGFWIVSMVTSGVLIGRLPVYTGLYATGILLPWELEHFFTKDSGKIVTIFAILAYTAFFYYQMHFTWGLM